MKVGRGEHLGNVGQTCIKEGPESILEDDIGLQVAWRSLIFQSIVRASILLRKPIKSGMRC